MRALTVSEITVKLNLQNDVEKSINLKEAVTVKTNSYGQELTVYSATAKECKRGSSYLILHHDLEYKGEIVKGCSINYKCLTADSKKKINEMLFGIN